MANQIQTRPNPRGRLLIRFLAISSVATTLVLVSVLGWQWLKSEKVASSIDWNACRTSIQTKAREATKEAGKTAALVAAKTTALVKMVTAKEPLKPSETIAIDPLQDTEKHLAQSGSSATELKALDQASGALAVQIAKFPDDASLHNRIGMIYSSLGDLTMATSHFQKAVDLCRAQLAIARAEEAQLRAKGQTQEACEKLLLASKLSVDLEAAHSSLARVFDKLGQHDKVVAQLDQLNRDLVFGTERPQRAISSILLGNSTASSQREAREAREAETAATAALKAATAPPVDKEEHQLNETALRLLARGQALMQARRLPEAEQVFKQVVSVDRLAAAPHEELGNIYMQCSNYGMAIQEFERASRLDPDNGTVYGAMAVAYQATGEIEHAIAMYGKSLTLRPKDADVAFNLGSLLASQGKYQEAADAFRKAVENNPKMAMAHNNLGSILSINQDYKSAALQFREAIAVAPDMASAHYGLGLALYHMKNYAASIPEFKRAVTLNPSLIDCHNKIERAYRKSGLAQGPIGMN